MVKQDGIYECKVCGNTVSVVEAYNPDIICCGQPMVLFEEKTIEQEGKEKHVPVISIENNNVIVKVGSVEHPMEQEHYIQLIQLMRDGKVIVEHHLNPGEKPEATFCLENTENLKTRELCNIHGLWTS